LNEEEISWATDAGERLHPLGLFVSVISGLPQLFVPILAGFFGTRQAGSTHYLPVIILAALMISVLFRSLGWMRFRYHSGADELRIESGVFDRKVRSIPYDRIQDVSIEQKFLPRMLGLAEVKFETGGGKGDEAKLSYVGTNTAGQLRELVRARKSEGVAEPATKQEVSQQVPPLYAMDMRRLLTLGLFSFSLFIFAVLFGVAQQLDFLLPFDFWDISGWIGIAEDRGGIALDGISWSARIIAGIAALAGLILIGIASGVIRTLLKDYGFRLDRTDKGFRRRRGLLNITDVVIPVHRVQAATVQTGPIRRRWGWHAFKFVSLADDSSAGKDEKDHVVAPLATMAEIAAIAYEAGIELPAPDTKFATSPPSVLIDRVLFVVVISAIAATCAAEFGQVGKSAALILLVPILFVPALWLDWRHSQSAATPTQIFVRHGWWRQRMTLAEQVNLQSAEIRQGPIARFRGLAHVYFGLAGGSLQIRAIPMENARVIQAAVVEAMCAVDYAKLGLQRADAAIGTLDH
jgi:putative membrane protein